MIHKVTIFLTLFLLFGFSQAQFRFSYENFPQVTESSNSISIPWAGGLNAPQFNTADLNGDQLDDLVIFDRTNANVQTFIQINNTYQYAPEFERLFPPDLEGWMLLRDYDCDGDKDIFTRSPFGIRMFRNDAEAGENIEFTIFRNIVFTQGNSGQINLQVNITDIPVIEDIDLDGDLDILTFDPGTGGNIEYHQNQTMEIYGICDSVAFVRVDDRWGNFEECFCQDFAFGETCEEKNGGRVLHASGKAILAIDFDDDGDKDLIYGDESCNEIMYLENIGDKDNALITDFTIDFPNATDPVFFNIFPGTFYEDIDFDGIKELIFAPNVFSNFTAEIDFKNSGWLYKNNGTPGNPDYQQVTTSFFQEDMIDLGDRATPAFADWDGDGDQDMVVGYDISEGGALVSKLALFENTGSASSPVFEEADPDLEGLSGLGISGMRPYFHDLNLDGRLDLIVSGTDNPPLLQIFFFENFANTGEPIAINPLERSQLDLNITTQDHLAFFDADLDGAPDAMVGTPQGNLQYFRNTFVRPFTYELIQNDYAGISTDPNRPSLVPFFIDLNRNNEPELITLDRSGRMRIFEDVRLSSVPNSFEEIIIVDENSPLVTTKFGNRTSISGADLQNDGSPDLVLGSAQGGLFFMENNSLDGNPTNDKITFNVYPNPGGVDSNFITVRSNRPGTYDIISVMGKVIQSNINIPGNFPTQIDISTLPPGLYILRARTQGFGSETKKVIIAQ